MMITAIISRVVILLFGTLYPAYASYKAVRTKDVKEYVKWMMYWIVFALFTCAETFTDLFISFWFPFYYEIKIVLVIWLLSPATKGSSILYRNFVHPALIKREPEIDEYISKAKEQGYHTMLQLGTKGVSYATNVIVQTAMKGGGGIVNHIRRSYSLSDLSSDPDTIADVNRNSKALKDMVDSAQVPRDLRLRAQRKQVGSHIDLYFPEMDVDLRTHSHELPASLSQIRSNEDISSGYSSGDPLYSEGQPPPEGNPLMRTASVGGVRARATRAARTSISQPKKPLTAEEEEGLTDYSGWPQAFPHPITSMYTELLSSLGLPAQALLNPDILEMVLNKSLINSQLPVNIFEVSEEQTSKSNTEDHVEVCEKQNLMETPIKSSGSAKDRSLNTVNSNKNSEDEVQDKCCINISDGKVEEPKSTFHLHNIAQTQNVSYEVLDKSSQQFYNLCTSDLVTSSTANNAVDSKENEYKRISECFEDATDVEISATNFLDCQESSFSKDYVTSNNGISKKLFEDTENKKKHISECFEDAVDVEISAANFLGKKEDFNSKDYITSSSDITVKSLEDTEKERKHVGECFEDATDVGMYDELDKNNLFPPKDDDFTNQTQSETTKQATSSNVSLASSNDPCFEDSIPDPMVVSRSGSLSMNDRKGKYKKKHAPLPPDVRKSAEPELLLKPTGNNEQNDEKTNPILLMGTRSVSEKSITQESSITDEKSNLNNDDVFQITQKNYVAPQLVEQINIPSTYTWRETSPSPSQKSKKDQSNFSRFLPRANVSSLFNLWGSKEGSTKSKASSNHSSLGNSYLSNAPSNLENKIQYVPDISESSKKEDNLSKSTPRIQIRQMSQSPSRRKHHEYQ